MDFVNELKKFGKNVAQKSSDIIEITKLNMSISQERDKINKLYREIGEAVYQQYKLGNDLGFGDKCGQVFEVESKIEEYQNKIMQIKNLAKCPGCGSEVGTETIYCSYCGAKVR
jgi:DNA-directed RNA polymerase subunit RPC12/RpoP